MMKLYTKQELSDLTGHTTSKINHDRTSGKLGGHRVGRSVVFTQKEVNAYKAGKKPPEINLRLHSTRQAAHESGSSVATIYRMIEDGRIEPYALGEDTVEYLFDDDMIGQIREKKNDPGRQVIDDGAYERAKEGEDGRFHVTGTTGKDGRELHYKTEPLAVQMVRKAIREPLQYRKGDLIFVKAGAMIHRAVVQHDVTAICLAAHVLVQGTGKPILVQKKQLKGVVNAEAMESLQQHNYVVIKDGRDV